MANSTPFFYQARSGHIRIGYGNVSTALTHEQIGQLCIDCYSLRDFSHDDFVRAYNPTPAALDKQAGEPLPSAQSGKE